MALNKILPIGFDDYRVLVDVRTAYLSTGNPWRILELIDANNHDALHRAVRLIQAQTLTDKVQSALEKGLLSVAEAEEIINGSR